MEKLYNIVNLVYKCQLFNIIVKPISRMISLCFSKPNEANMKEKGSDEELENIVLKKRKLSYTNLTNLNSTLCEESEAKVEEEEENIKNNKPRFPSRIMFNIDDRRIFIKNSKSKAELKEKMELFEESLYIPCKYCGKEISKSDIFCMFDNYYCSEQCRHRMMYKK